MNKLKLKNDKKDGDRNKINNDGMPEYLITMLRDMNGKLKILTGEVVRQDNGGVSAKNKKQVQPTIVKEPVKPPLKDLQEDIDGDNNNG